MLRIGIGWWSNDSLLGYSTCYNALRFSNMRLVDLCFDMLNRCHLYAVLYRTLMKGACSWTDFSEADQLLFYMDKADWVTL